MTHVITGLCLRHGGCEVVCPVACIVPGQPVDDWPTYYIDPARCTDCGECIPACPYNAIWPQDAVPDELREAIAENRRFFREGPGYAARRR